MAAADVAVQKAKDDDARQKSQKAVEAARLAVKRAAAALASAEGGLKGCTEVFARGPLKWDAGTATLTIPLDGYGVRLVRLK